MAQVTGTGAGGGRRIYSSPPNWLVAQFAKAKPPAGYYSWYDPNNRIRYYYFWNGKSISKWGQTKPDIPQQQVTVSGGGGGYGYGGGGGGGGGGDPTRMYVEWYRALGISPNMALVKEAAKNNWSIGRFEMEVRKRDTANYMKSWRGRQEVAAVIRYLRQWAPYTKTVGYAGGKPFGWAKNIIVKSIQTKRLDPESLRGMVEKTEFYKRIFKQRGFEAAAPSIRSSPLRFREYMSAFRDIYLRYYNRKPDQREYYTFFSRHMTPQQFEENIQFMMQAQPAYEWMTGGQGLTTGQQKQLLFGRMNQEQLRNKLAVAYQLRKSYFSAKPSVFEPAITNEGFVQKGVFAND